jgi:hypothetical protein
LRIETSSSAKNTLYIVLSIPFQNWKAPNYGLKVHLSNFLPHWEFIIIIRGLQYPYMLIIKELT